MVLGCVGHLAQRALAADEFRVGERLIVPVAINGEWHAEGAEQGVGRGEEIVERVVGGE